MSTDSAMRGDGRLRLGARQFPIVDAGTVITWSSCWSESLGVSEQGMILTPDLHQAFVVGNRSGELDKISGISIWRAAIMVVPWLVPSQALLITGCNQAPERGRD